MPRSRSSKCRDWEKERRNRFNEAFVSLAKVLPNHDPSVNIPKLDILHKAKAAIVELQAQVATVENLEEKESAKTNLIKKFQNRIRVLLNRNEQLGNLLKDAKITIPKNLEPIKTKKNLPWAGKVKPEQAEYFQKKEMEKENVSQSSEISRKVRNTKKSCKKIKPQTCRKNSINKAAGSKCVIVLPQSKYLNGAMRQGSAILGNTFSKPHVKGAGVTSISKPVCISGNALSSLGPGTLIFPNGTALPLVTQSPIYFPPSVTFLANPVSAVQLTVSKAVQKASQFVVKKTVGVKKYTSPTIPKICLTTTTQVNKVPIPALSTNYTNTVLLKSAKKTVASKSSASEGNKKCLKRKAAVLPSEASKKVKCDAASVNGNEIVDAISTAISTSSDSTNKAGKNDDNPKVDTANVSKIDSCNADGDMNEKSDVKINSGDGLVINREKSTNKENQVGISELKTNNLVITNDIQANHEKMVEPQSVMDGKVDVFEESTDLLPTTDTSKPETVTRHESSEKGDIVSAIEGSVKPIASCTKDTLPSGISQDTKTDHTHSELSNDIFGALTVGASCQNPESTSPTAAFLMTFPLVSSVKATEVTDEENVEGHDTENLLQSSNLDTNKSALPDNLANSLLNLDTFSFFSCSNFLNKCSTALGNENFNSNIVCTNVKSPILQADFSESVNRDPHEINKKSDAYENKSSHQQVQCHDGHQKHNNIPKETPTIKKSTHNEVVIASPHKNENFGFSDQSVATGEDKFKESAYNSFVPQNKDKQNSGKLLTYQEPLQNSSHLDIKCMKQTDKIKAGRINSSSEKTSSNKMLNSQKQNMVGSKDLDSYYHDLSGLKVNDKGENHSAEDADGNKNISSVKCNEDNVEKNAINFNLPFITQNIFEQNVKDCYTHKRNDNLESRIKIDSLQVPQNTAIKVLPNIGNYNYTNSWNLPKYDDKLSGDKNSASYRKPDQTSTKSTYSLNDPDANKYNLAQSDSKTIVSQDHIQSRPNISKNTAYSNSNKPDSKQTKSQGLFQNSTKALYDFNVSEAVTYPAKSIMTFCADKNTVSHQSIPPNSTKYNITVSESSGNKNTVAPSLQAIQNAKKATYGFDVSSTTSYNLYPNSAYNSRSLNNVSESYIFQNMPVISKPAITPGSEYRSAEFGIHPTNVPLGFGSNHFDKVASSLCGVKSTTTPETFVLNSGSDLKKFQETRDSRLQPSALQSEINNRIAAADNVHCANIFEDKNISSSKHIPGVRPNTQYSFKTSEYGQNHLYTNYQHVAEFQSKSDNTARMANVIYPERISSTVNNSLPDINIQNLYDKKQNSHVYHQRVSSKDDKQGSVGTLNQEMYRKKQKIGEFAISREKHGDSMTNPGDIMKKSNSVLQQQDICYKEKTKNVPTVRSINKVSNDIFPAQTGIDIVNQSNKDGNQISQLYMMNLPSGSCHYQSEDAKTCSYMNINKSYSGALYTNSTNYSRYNYTTDVSLNQNYYKPATSKSFGQDKLLEGVPNLDANKYCDSPVKKPGSELKSNPFNPPVNWMTTADSKTECLLPQLSTPSYTFASTDEAKQYTWSTTKFPNIFEPPQAFVTHSVPSLPFNPSSLIEQKPKEKKTTQQENQSNFLSVSQLVEHNKNDTISGPARVTARRNSGNRSKGTNPNKNKRITKTDTVDKSVQNKQNSGFMVTNEYCYEQKQCNRNRTSNSYSAEALIGNQGNEFSNKKVVSAESKSLVTTNFLADSMVTYFSSVDDNYMPHNNLPTNNFSHNSFQSNPYPTNNFLYSTPSVAPMHAPTNAFETPPDFLSESIAEMKDLNTKHTKLMNKDEKNQTCNNSGVKKSRKKQTNDSNSFETTFPPVNETSILNEDFLHNTFLAPTTPYPSKTNVCQKQSIEFNANSLLPLPGLARNVGQSIESSPSLNTAGTSLTNFNLSTIFPEINKVSFSSETKYNFNS